MSVASQLSFQIVSSNLRHSAIHPKYSAAAVGRACVGALQCYDGEQAGGMEG